MAQAIDKNQIESILKYDDEQRAKYFIKEAVANQQIWILKDEHGCVMLTTDDEDCIPVWPNEAFAASWISQEWQDCQTEAISLNKWLSRWSHGLADDGLAIVVFPNQDEQGLVFYPDELEDALKTQQQKQAQQRSK